MRRQDSAARSRAWRSVAALLGAAAAIALVTAPSGRVAADGPNRAAIVVTFSEGHSESRCVEFSEPEISGAELLRRSGLPVVASSQAGGAAICQIGDVGCANPNDCFCKCHGGSCQYWAYYALEDGQWQYASAGSSLRKLHDGDVDGWAWGSGSIGNGAKPELRTFDEVCPPLSPTMAPSPPSPEPPPVASEVEAPPAVVSPAPQPPASDTPLPTSVASPTPRPGAQSAAAETQDEDAEIKGGRKGGVRLPLQFAAFGGLAVALLTTAMVLSRRRARG